MKLYPAVFTPSDGYITVTFPDVPGAITQGKDIEEAHAMAVEVLGFALEDYSEYPKATPIHELKEQYPDIDTLSMGMSQDYKLAIKHGWNTVRIGRAIFE